MNYALIDDAQYAAWLQNPAEQRVVLVDLHHADGIEYVASRPFISHPNDSAPNRAYRDLLINAVDISVRIDSALQVGDLTLIDDGSISHWVNHKWRGHAVEIRLGGQGWRLDDFRVIATQINGGLVSASRSEIVLGVYEASALLDDPIERPELANGQPRALVLGHVLGAAATRINTTYLQYSVSWLVLFNLVVRDGNGPLISHTPNLAAGEFTANAYSPRELWCEVWEQHDTAEKILNWVAAQYGLLVAPNLTLPNYQLGLYYTDAVTGRQILDDVCTAIGGHWSLNALGQLAISVFSLPTTPTVFISADDIEFDRIRLIRTEEPIREIRLNYAKNNNPMTEVAGSIADSDSELAERLRTEFHTETVTNLVPDYPLSQTNEIETALQNKVDAQAEAARRALIRAVRHEVWELDVFIRPELELIGKSVEVLHAKLAGRIGVIVSHSLSPVREIATLEVWF